MLAATSSPPLLDESNARFTHEGVSIIVSSRNAAMRPAASLACGCRVSDDRREITVFINRDQSPDVLDNLVRTGAIAVNFSQPSTHRSIQLKGVDARLEPVLPEDLELISTYRDSFVADLARIYFPEPYAHTIIPAPNRSLAAVCFTLTQVFDQTPGHNAGRTL
jgi:hypothetical protein